MDQPNIKREVPSLRELCEQCAELEDRAAKGLPGENIIDLGDYLRIIVDEMNDQGKIRSLSSTEEMVKICEDALEVECTSTGLAWGRNLAMMRDRLAAYRK